MKMRQENSELVQEKKKKKSSEEDIDDNESIETVSDDEFDKYLGKLKFLYSQIRCLFIRPIYG
jgi:hypothetical protein